MSCISVELKWYLLQVQLDCSCSVGPKCMCESVVVGSVTDVCIIFSVKSEIFQLFIRSVLFSFLFFFSPQK